MKIKDLSKEDLETMGYDEISEMILLEKNAKMKIVDIFKKICSLLNMTDAEFENKIADFFELISTDKKFIVLDKGFCDLRKKHTPKPIIEDDEDEVIEIEPNEDESVTPDDEDEEAEDNIFYENSGDEDDVEDDTDELSDFIVVDEEETSI